MAVILTVLYLNIEDNENHQNSKNKGQSLSSYTSHQTLTEISIKYLGPRGFSGM